MIIRNRVDLPAPFGPTSPTFSPLLSCAEASTKRICCAVLLADVVETNHGLSEGACERSPGAPARRAIELAVSLPARVAAHPRFSAVAASPSAPRPPWDCWNRRSGRRAAPPAPPCASRRPRWRPPSRPARAGPCSRASPASSAGLRGLGAAAAAGSAASSRAGGRRGGLAALLLQPPVHRRSCPRSGRPCRRPRRRGWRWPPCRGSSGRGSPAARCRRSRSSSRSRTLRVTMSRSLVGSSSTSTLAPSRNSRASSSRLRSPPESAFTFMRCIGTGKSRSSR